MEDFNSSLKINQITEEEKLIKETYKLTLKQRKQEVQNELKKENLDLEKLQYLYCWIILTKIYFIDTC